MFRARRDFLPIPEQKRNAPDGGNPYQRIDDTADDTALAAANPGDDIKLEDPDGSPVDPADDGQRQRDSIENNQCCSPQSI